MADFAGDDVHSRAARDSALLLQPDLGTVAKAPTLAEINRRLGRSQPL